MVSHFNVQYSFTLATSKTDLSPLLENGVIHGSGNIPLFHRKASSDNTNQTPYAHISLS